MPVLTKRHTHGLQCVSCTDVMKGIFSYKIRQDCAPCGGHSKVQRSRAVTRARRGMDPVPPMPPNHDGWTACQSPLFLSLLSRAKMWMPIVVESLNSNQFDANQLQADLESVADDFAQMIATLRPHIPTPCDAAERGL